MMKEALKLLDKLNKGMEAYHNDVEAMTDKELWDHCFSDDDIKESDFCVQELKKRFLYGNFEDTEKANQYLLDSGSTQQEIDEMAKGIADRVKETINKLNIQPPLSGQGG
jgi:hypothetical protein